MITLDDIKRMDNELLTVQYIKREEALMKLMQDGCSAKNLQSILDMPAADVAPVIHAHWEEYLDYNCYNYSYCCSNCGKNALTKEGTMHDQVLTGFCPYCGAKMDEPVEEDK